MAGNRILLGVSVYLAYPLLFGPPPLPHPYAEMSSGSLESKAKVLLMVTTFLALTSLSILALKSLTTNNINQPPRTTSSSQSREQSNSMTRTTSTTNTPKNASPYTGSRTIKSWCPPRVDKAGVISDLELCTTLPYSLSIGGACLPVVEQTISTCELYRSVALTNVIFEKLTKTRLSGTKDVFFSDIVDIVLNKGSSRVYVYGGFLRDIITGKDADDLDFLFRSSGGSVVPFLEAALLRETLERRCASGTRRTPRSTIRRRRSGSRRVIVMRARVYRTSLFFCNKS
jgi:hypothetical protein